MSNRKEEREERSEERVKREKRGEWIPHITRMPCQHLTIILIPFNHFNGLSHDKD